MARIQFIVIDTTTKAQIGEPQASVGAARAIAKERNSIDGDSLFRRYRVKPFYSDAARTDISIELLQAKFPELRITYGYIGNCDTIDPSRYDDRQWMIFTTVKDAEHNWLRIELDGPKFDVVEIALRLEVLAEQVARKAG